MLQNKLLTFYFELKLPVRRMENISLTEICRLLASCCPETRRKRAPAFSMQIAEMKAENYFQYILTHVRNTKTRQNSIVEYLDYQIPVTQLNSDMQVTKRD